MKNSKAWSAALMAVALAMSAWTPCAKAQTSAFGLPLDGNGDVITIPTNGTAGVVVGFDDTEAVTIGFSFSVTDADVLVYSLGFFDSGRDGLTQDHPVGIWNQSGTLIASTTVGATASLIGDHRYTDLVAPIALTAGNYVLAALAPTGSADDGYQPFRAASGTDLTVNPLIMIGSNASLFDYGASLQFPITNFPAGNYRIYASPNMLLAPVPEPSTVALIMVGFVMATKRRRLRAF